MSGKRPIIDDQLIGTMGQVYKTAGASLELMIKNYVMILKSIRAGALLDGSTSKRFGTYIQYAEKLSGKVEAASLEIQRCLNGYLDEVNDKNNSFRY